MANPSLKYNNKVVKLSSSVRIISPFYPIPPYSVRFLFYGRDKEFDPTSLETESWQFMGTWTHVAGSVWDFTYQGENWYAYGNNVSMAGPYLYGIMSMRSRTTAAGSDYYIYKNSYEADGSTLQSHDFDILGANLTGVRRIPQLFYKMLHLRNVALFDTSMITTASEMFGTNSTSKTRLTIIPDFNFSNVNSSLLPWDGGTLPDNKGKPGLVSFAFYNTRLTRVPNLTLPTDTTVPVATMFSNTKNVESGALALYNKFAAANWTGDHSSCFTKCGYSTVTGAADLAQIPTSWGGTLSG